MFTSYFWKDAAERAIATFAQTVLALAAVNTTDLASLDWWSIIVVALIAGALAVLKALAAKHYGEETPSIVEYTYPEPAIAVSTNDEAE